MKETNRSFSRRDFFVGAASAGAVYAAGKLTPVAALAAAPAVDSRVAATPLVDKGFAAVRQIGKGVYATISDRTKGLQTRSNGGFIIGRDGVLLIEGFQTPVGAAFQLEAMRMVTQTPVRAALNTHYHFDHSLGNSYYGGQGIPIWAHAKVPARMMEIYPKWQAEDRATFLVPWEKRVAEAKTDAQREHAKSDIEGLLGMFDPVSQSVLALPSHPLDPAKMPMTVDLGGVSVIIDHYIAHTDTDLIFRVPDQNIVFAGDVVVGAQYPTNINGYPTSWRNALAKMAQFDKDTLFIPGHGQPCGLEGVALMRAVFDDIAAQGEKLYKAGVPAEEATERYVVPERWKDFRQFSWGFCIGRTIEQFYAEWSGKAVKVLNYS